MARNDDYPGPRGFGGRYGGASQPSSTTRSEPRFSDEAVTRMQADGHRLRYDLLYCLLCGRAAASIAEDPYPRVFEGDRPRCDENIVLALMAEAEAAPPPPAPLHVNRLAEADHLNKTDKVGYCGTDHETFDEHMQWHRWRIEGLADFYTRLTASTEPQKHAAWCYLDDEHSGMCEGDQ